MCKAKAKGARPTRRDMHLSRWRPASGNRTTRPPPWPSICCCETRTWIIGATSARARLRRPASFTTSYVAIRGLAAFGTPEQAERIASRREQVRAWLAKSTAKDNEDRVFRLLAMEAVDAPAGDIEAAVKELSERQREDGGWAQLDAGEPSGPRSPMLTRPARRSSRCSRPAACAPTILSISAACSFSSRCRRTTARGTSLRAASRSRHISKPASRTARISSSPPPPAAGRRGRWCWRVRQSNRCRRLACTCGRGPPDAVSRKLLGG